MFFALFRKCLARINPSLYTSNAFKIVKSGLSCVIYLYSKLSLQHVSVDHKDPSALICLCYPIPGYFSIHDVAMYI